MFPCVKIEHEWADEDIGANCGRRTYYNGERIEEYYPDYGKESIEFAAKVMEIQLEEHSQERPKPRCPLIGADGNVFNLIGIAARTLRRNGMRDEAKEMSERVTNSGSYNEALSIIGEYVDICSDDEMEEETIDIEGGMTE